MRPPARTGGPSHATAPFATAVAPSGTGSGASPSTKKSSGRSGFYWHFADRAELIAATLELWEQLATTETIDRIQSIPDPRERLTALAAGAYAGAA
ncbi:MAG: hypothetical protein M3Q92_15360 [Actinomycetota bacterium]|nr:hypothetical protein [Actinomycetota bacterium]